MAKKTTEKLGDTVESLRPYLERALKDDDIRKDLRDALAAARDVYGDLAKDNGGVRAAAKLATDKDVQENLRRALEDLGDAADRVRGKKESHKARKTLLLAGVVAGALYNPWTGAQTRKWIMDKIAGDDDLQPLESWDASEGSSNGEPVSVDAQSSSDAT